MLGNGNVLPGCSPFLQQGCYQSPNAYECFKAPLMHGWAVQGLLDARQWEQHLWAGLGWPLQLFRAEGEEDQIQQQQTSWVRSGCQAGAGVL